MEYIAILLAIISMFISYKTSKSKKKTSDISICKNALNQKVLNTVLEYDKKGKQIIFCELLLDGEELSHIVVNIKDLSVISPDITVVT